MQPNSVQSTQATKTNFHWDYIFCAAKRPFSTPSWLRNDFSSALSSLAVVRWLLARIRCFARVLGRWSWPLWSSLSALLCWREMKTTRYCFRRYIFVCVCECRFSWQHLAGRWVEIRSDREMNRIVLWTLTQTQGMSFVSASCARTLLSCFSNFALRSFCEFIATAIFLIFCLVLIARASECVERHETTNVYKMGNVHGLIVVALCRHGVHDNIAPF